MNEKREKEKELDNLEVRASLAAIWAYQRLSLSEIASPTAQFLVDFLKEELLFQEKNKHLY